MQFAQNFDVIHEEQKAHHACSESVGRAVLKLNSVSLSNNTTQRSITEMYTYINEQVLMKVQSSKDGFAIKLDRTKEESNCAQLLVFVRYAIKDSIRSELLICNELRTTAIGEDVFELVDNFIKECLQWSKVVGFATDGAPAMLGRKSEFQARVNAVSPSVFSVYCFIH